MNKSKKNAAFTLIELVVVLMVLVALAGILLPQFSGMVSRTHTAAASTNFAEINKAVNFYAVKTLQGYPDKLDIPLHSNGGAAPTALADTLQSQTDMSVVTLAANQIQSLTNAGITTVYPLFNMADLPTTVNQSATFGGTDLANPVLYTGATTAPAVQMSDARAAHEFGSSLQGAVAGEMYVIFGLNDSSTAIPTAMMQAPVHFDQVDPAKVYSRFFLVFAIPSNTTAQFNARFVGSVGAELSGWSGHISDYYGKNSQ